MRSGSTRGPRVLSATALGHGGVPRAEDAVSKLLIMYVMLHCALGHPHPAKPQRTPARASSPSARRRLRSDSALASGGGAGAPREAGAHGRRRRRRPVHVDSDQQRPESLVVSRRPVHHEVATTGREFDSNVEDDLQHFLRDRRSGVEFERGAGVACGQSNQLAEVGGVDARRRRRGSRLSHSRGSSRELRSRVHRRRRTGDADPQSREVAHLADRSGDGDVASAWNSPPDDCRRKRPPIRSCVTLATLKWFSTHTAGAPMHMTHPRSLTR